MKQLLALAFVASVILSSVGCGGSTTSASTTKSTSASGASTEVKKNP